MRSFFFLYFISISFFKPKLKSASYFAITVSLFSAGVFLGNPHNYPRHRQNSACCGFLFRQIALFEIICRFITLQSLRRRAVTSSRKNSLTLVAWRAVQPFFAVCIFWARDVPRLISAALIESLRERCTGIGFPLTEWK